MSAAIAPAASTSGLGTDCAPHNLIEEMRLAIVAGRLMSEDIASLDTGGAFEAATIGGARALGRDDIGVLAPGARPTSCWSTSPIR